MAVYTACKKLSCFTLSLILQLLARDAICLQYNRALKHPNRSNNIYHQAAWKHFSSLCMLAAGLASST